MFSFESLAPSPLCRTPWESPNLSQYPPAFSMRVLHSQVKMKKVRRAFYPGLIFLISFVGEQIKIPIKNGKINSIVICLLCLFSEDYIQAHALIEDCLDFKDSDKKYWKLKRDSVCMYVRSPLKAVLVLHHLTGTTLKRQKHVLSWNVTRRQWRRPMSNKEWRCALWYVATTFNHEKCPNIHKLYTILCVSD